MADFKYFDEPVRPLEDDGAFPPMMEMAERKKPDDSRLITRKGGKKRKDKGMEYKREVLPSKDVDYNKIFS